MHGQRLLLNVYHVKCLNILFYFIFQSDNSLITV